MDVATHALIGWTLSRAGLNRLTPHATWIAVLGAVAPDADLALRVTEPVEYLLWHRGPTHSWIVAPVLAIICVALVRAVVRKPLPWAKAWMVAMAGMASHLVVDALNPLGAQWLWPFSDRWFSADVTVRGDPWIVVILAVAILAQWLSKLVSSEIGGKTAGGRTGAILALILVGLYLGVRQQLNLRAIAMVESRVYERLAPKRAAAVPYGANPLIWTGLADTGSFLRQLPIDVSTEYDPDAGDTFYPPGDARALAAVEGGGLYRKVKSRLTWPVAEAIPEEEHVRVEIRDLRLGLVYSATVSRDGKLLSESVGHPK